MCLDFRVSFRFFKLKETGLINKKCHNEKKMRKEREKKGARRWGEGEKEYKECNEITESNRSTMSKESMGRKESKEGKGNTVSEESVDSKESKVSTISEESMGGQRV